MPANELGPSPDFQNEDWPVAVDQDLIVPETGEPERIYRALQIKELIGIPTDDQIVLDCGCGEGFVAQELANTATKVVGYDLKVTDWESRAKDNLIFTTEKQKVESSGPFNLIILYDVLDHLEAEDPPSFLTWLASLLAPEGKVFVRTHPWTSRHGGHLYDTVNKAFVHLTMTTDELVTAGLHLKEPNIRVVRPMAAYEAWFKKAGLSTHDKRVKTTEVEPFFSDEVLDRIIKTTWAGTVEPDTARKIMANTFVDYTLTK